MEFGQIFEYNNRWYLVNNWLMPKAVPVMHDSNLLLLLCINFVNKYRGQHRYNYTYSYTCVPLHINNNDNNEIKVLVIV